MSHAQSKRSSRMVSSPALVGFAALAALTRSVAKASLAYDTYPLVGCYKDTRQRVMSRQLQVVPLSVAGCCNACLGDGETGEEWKFAGLQYGQEW